MVAAGYRGRVAAGHARLRAATALTCVLAVLAPLPEAAAQDFGTLPSAGSFQGGSKMLLEADMLTYDNDRDVVTASGSVRISYSGNRLVADKIIYNRRSGRMLATGGVQIIDNNGVKYFSQEIDVTDDFADGFANALRAETIDKTYFASESAKREGGKITTFYNGVYTACEPCEESPGRPPIWRVKARRIIWNQQEKIVRFEHSRFELFGLPIAYFPAFEVPDPTVKRKSGFLFPSFNFQTHLGFGVTVPYYFALSPTFDMTLQGTYYSKQGFLGEVEFRKRFNNGLITLKTAGIRQNDPNAFPLFTTDRSEDDDDDFLNHSLNYRRGMVGINGKFDINPSWTFGWDLMTQTDKNFSKTYSIDGYSDTVRRDEVYLTGLYDRSFFDLRVMQFQIQEEALDSRGGRDKEQPFLYPSLDYSFTPDEPVWGGELNLNLNSRLLSRDELDAFTPSASNDPRLENDPFIRGLEGQNGRITAEAEWKRTFITSGGLVLTPLLAFQADADYSDPSDESLDRLGLLADRLDASDEYTGIPVEDEVSSAFARAMATLGLELRWPVLFSSTSATHILEPMAQVFARPNEPYLGSLGLPNEDAQSFVFDATTLFERDKFSGYDRIEGGTRANLGLRYSGTYGNGWTTNAIVGQSFMLAGENSFDAPDLVSVGAYSGLESRESDFVGLVGFATPIGFSASASGRFDEKTFEMRRGELRAAYAQGPLSLAGSYAFIQEQPLYGFSEDRQEATVSGGLRFAENWRVLGTGTFDLEKQVLTSNAIGLSYDDECFSATGTYSQTRNRDTLLEEQNFGVSISFRTIGTFGSQTDKFNKVLGGS